MAFTTHVLDGARVWETHFRWADVVITHPNGWGLREQEFMRRAVVAAGIVPQSSARDGIFFVTEGEASLYYCIFHADLAYQLKVRGLLLLIMTISAHMFRYDSQMWISSSAMLVI